MSQEPILKSLKRENEPERIITLPSRKIPPIKKYLSYFPILKVLSLVISFKSQTKGLCQGKALRNIASREGNQDFFTLSKEGKKNFLHTRKIIPFQAFWTRRFSKAYFAHKDPTQSPEDIYKRRVRNHYFKEVSNKNFH